MPASPKNSTMTATEAAVNPPLRNSLRSTIGWRLRSWATAEWVDWYNAKRLHSAIGHVPPDEYESMYHAQLQPRKVVGANN